MSSQARPIALVTGASSGIGAGFATRLAARDTDLVLVARRADRLEAIATSLRRRNGVKVDVVVADLTDPGAPARIVQAVHAGEMRIATLINCAGFGTAGRFVDEDPQRLANEIAVDVTAPTLLARLALPDLLAERGGALVMVSSSASHQPVPNLAAYAASKAFVTSLTAAIWQEVRGSGLRVLALCPGPTETEFFAAAGSDRFKVGRVASVDEVLDAAFHAIDQRRGGPVCTVGLGNRAQAIAARLAPRRLTLAIGQRATSEHA